MSNHHNRRIGHSNCVQQNQTSIPWLWEGVLAEGIVLRVELSGVRVNGVPQWQLRYGYHDHLGQLREGCSDWFSPEEAAQWPEGANGTVRFDRQRPEDSLWVGK